MQLLKKSENARIESKIIELLTKGTRSRSIHNIIWAEHQEYISTDRIDGVKKKYETGLIKEIAEKTDSRDWRTVLQNVREHEYFKKRPLAQVRPLVKQIIGTQAKPEKTKPSPEPAQTKRYEPPTEEKRNIDSFLADEFGGQSLHSRRLVTAAKHLLQSTEIRRNYHPFDKTIILKSAMLHGVPEDSARTFLARKKLPGETIDNIIHCMRSHGPIEIKPPTKEAKLAHAASVLAIVNRSHLAELSQTMGHDAAIDHIERAVTSPHLIPEVKRSIELKWNRIRPRKKTKKSITRE